MAKAKKAKKPEPANTFGGRIKAIRERLKMKQEEMSPGLGLSSTRLSEIENDKSKPCHDFFYNIIKNYRANPYYLLFGEGEMFGESREEILTDVTKIKTGDKIIDEFLYYFFNSPMAHSYLIYHFRKLLSDEKQAIIKELESSREEERST